MKADDIYQLEAAHILQVYRRNKVAFARGSGSRLYDVDGREYIDLISGIGVAALGHAHPALARALAEQAQTLIHTSNLYFHELQGQVASRLAALSGLSRAFFCNSGTEAIEACLKFARRFWYTRGDARHEYVAFEHAFHGRTFGSLSVTWDEHYRAPFAPLLPGVRFVPVDDVGALDAAVSSSTAAIILEPIQGEGGVRPLSQKFAQAITAAAVRSGALVIADEVQCGLGRTGRAFYSPVLGLKPDLMALGKALGAGVPVGAALMSERVASAVKFGDHGSTYGGNLLAMRAALVFLDALEGGLLEHVRTIGEHADRRLSQIASRYPSIVSRRGVGLMHGMEMQFDAAPVVEAALRHGVLINRTAERVVRLLPALTIEERDLDAGLERFEAALAEVTITSGVGPHPHAGGVTA